MNSKDRFNFPVSCLVALLILVSCVPAPTLSSPTATPLQPTTSPQPTATADEFSVLQAGQSYRDSSDDMDISFLDVTGFQATVNEDSEILEVTLHLRDIPTTVTRRQIINVSEYMWEISIFHDPAAISSTDPQPDYYLFLMTLATDPPTGGEGIMEPRAGEPETVP